MIAYGINLCHGLVVIGKAVNINLHLKHENIIRYIWSFGLNYVFFQR